MWQYTFEALHFDSVWLLRSWTWEKFGMLHAQCSSTPATFTACWIRFIKKHNDSLSLAWYGWTDMPGLIRLAWYGWAAAFSCSAWQWQITSAWLRCVTRFFVLSQNSTVISRGVSTNIFFSWRYFQLYLVTWKMSLFWAHSCLWSRGALLSRSLTTSSSPWRHFAGDVFQEKLWYFKETCLSLSAYHASVRQVILSFSQCCHVKILRNSLDRSNLDCLATQLNLSK